MSYQTTQDHLLDELARIDTILNSCDPIEMTSSFEIDRESTVDTADLRCQPQSLPLALPKKARQQVTEQAEQITQHCQQTDEATLRIRVLAETFDLSRRHLDVLMLALAPRLDQSYQSMFQQLHNRESLAFPTEMLLEHLFASSPQEQIAAGALIGSDSPLCRHNLLEFQPCPDPVLGDRGRLLTVPDRIVDYLKGYDGVDPNLEATLADYATTQDDALTECDASTTLSELTIDDDLYDRLDTLSESTIKSRRCYWYGPAGTEKHRAVESLCSTDQYLKADLRAVLEADVLEWLGREAALLGRPLHLTHATAGTTNHQATTLESVFNILAELDVDVFVTGSESWTPTEAMTTSVDAIIEFPYPSIELRQAFWESHRSELPADVDPVVLAGTFRLTHGQLRAALSTARSLADSDELTTEDLYAGCSAQSADGLADLAQHIEPDSDWDEIQLRAKTERKLRLVRTHIKQQATIYSDWGFAEQFTRGTGVVALFEGPSGTGKTMAAEILAGDVGMDLYKIDLSSIVSKYIGETEKNLEEIFEAATNSNAILLFDEADAVFGDRAEVSDATDRYANAEVNYLLQRIESYDGVVLLTTNYSSNIDSAFQRRIDHTVSFKQPQQDTRNAIWEEIFPDDAPLGEIDYEFLSSFKFTGGQIKTIGQTAAILAADAGGMASAESTIEMEHLIQAVQLEFEKNGRAIEPGKFETYRELLYDESTNDRPVDAQSTSEPQTENDAEDDCDVDSGPTDEKTIDKPDETDHDSTVDTETAISPDEIANPAVDRVDPKTNDDIDSADAVDKPAGPNTNDDDESQPSNRTPEDIVNQFVDRLSAGDREGVHELYHPRATITQFSPKDLARLERGELSIVSEFNRVREDPSRVVLAFVQNLNGTAETVSYELRLDDGSWRIFSWEQTTDNPRLVQ
jgi:SpoVK/Ycf46/Vps4 family AAA+-type ATPase